MQSLSIIDQVEFYGRLCDGVGGGRGAQTWPQSSLSNLVSLLRKILLRINLESAFTCNIIIPQLLG